MEIKLTPVFWLHPAVPPSIQAGPRVMKVQEGHPVELPCTVRGVPEPTLTWTKDGNRYPVSPDGSLAFRNVGLDDEGTYTCTATNTAGKDEARVQLLVQGWSISERCVKLNNLCWHRSEGSFVTGVFIKY